MNFAHPKVLWISALVLPLLALFLWATWRKRQALIRQFVQHKLLAQQTLGISAARQKLRRIVFFTATIFGLLAVAGPQWGFTWEEATQRGRDIIVAIDTSRSMLAEDIQPNRLARAKLAALDLLKLGKFDRFGLIAFAGTAFLQCPLTFDDEAFRQNVQLLEPGVIPQGGTALSQAIQAARDAFSNDTDDNHRILVLFTDGEDHEAGVLETVQRAANDNLKIFTVGVGTPGGELLRMRDERGAPAYVKDDEGNVVKSRLNEELLNMIAAKTSGFYVPLQGGNPMEVLYQKGIAPLPTSDRSTQLTKSYKHQFYWPLVAAIVLLVIEVFISDQKRAPRSKSSPTHPANRSVATTAAAIFLLALLPNLEAGPAKARRHYQAGEFKSALSEYQEMLGKNPGDARLHYNAGAAAYKANKFDLALREFQASTGSNDIDLQQQSFYNLGNSEFRLGQAASDPQERIALWEQAVQHYDEALKINPGDKDAEFNRDFVKKKLEELKKQQEDQKKNENKDNKQEDQQDKDDSSKDKQQQDNKDQQDNETESKEDKQKQQDNRQNPEDPRKKEQQQNQQEQQKQQEQDKQQNNQPKPGNDQKESDQQPQEDGGQFGQLGKMTPAQAKQLLDAQREQEKALIFLPQERKGEPRDRSFKDW